MEKETHIEIEYGGSMGFKSEYHLFFIQGTLYGDHTISINIADKTLKIKHPDTWQEELIKLTSNAVEALFNNMNNIGQKPEYILVNYNNKLTGNYQFDRFYGTPDKEMYTLLVKSAIERKKLWY
jgi:hypothetical protein